MEIVGRYINVGEVELYYEENTPASGPAIVCVHIAGRESRQYHGMMEGFGSRVRLLAPDMPAHGKSRPLPGNRAIDDRAQYTDFLWGFMSALGVEDACVLGCSLGGNLMFDLAQRYPVKAVITLQGLDYTPSISAVARTFMNHPHVSLQHSHLDYSVSLMGSGADEAARDFVKWGVCQEIAVTKKADLGMYNGFDVRGGMGGITCPVLMIRGLEDWIVDAEANAETLARITRSSRLAYREIPGTGHFPAVENPAALCALIEEFMARL
jgi:pimeloyl-ACP methyl ester carboxylesterase